MSDQPSLGHVPVASSPRERFVEYLQSRGMRVTQQRLALVDHVFSRHEHFDAEQLMDQLPRAGQEGHVSRPTVYRTLKLLTECGLAAERRFGEGQTMYEAAGDLEHHDHLICLECGHVLEFHNEAIEREQERVARSFGFTVIRHRHELYGLCPRARGIKGGSCPGDEARAAGQATGRVHPGAS